MWQSLRISSSLKLEIDEDDQKVQKVNEKQLAFSQGEFPKLKRSYAVLDFDSVESEDEDSQHFSDQQAQVQAAKLKRGRTHQELNASEKHGTAGPPTQQPCSDSCLTSFECQSPDLRDGQFDFEDASESNATGDMAVDTEAAIESSQHEVKQGDGDAAAGPLLEVSRCTCPICLSLHAMFPSSSSHGSESSESDWEILESSQESFNEPVEDAPNAITAEGSLALNEAHHGAPTHAM